MEHTSHEPASPGATPRPCSTPHSAPAAWLSRDPATDNAPLSPEHDFLAAYERIAPDAERRDGWTPFLRKLFLQVIADTGRMSLACECTAMSRSSAYALAARDRVFAAGWDAAAFFARRPLADDVYEKGMDGITEAITRGDGLVVTRHRYDGRLSMAVLARLDRRCDRAEEQGSVHLAAVRQWDDYLRLVGEGDDKAAEALLDTARDRPTCPLPERANPIPLPDLSGDDPADSVWQKDGVWMTVFPPPPGFAGRESREWNGLNYYERECSPDEAELLDANRAAAEAEERAELTACAEAERDSFFGKAKAELEQMRGTAAAEDDGSGDPLTEVELETGSLSLRNGPSEF